MHYVKNVRIRSYPGPRVPALGLNTERYEMPTKMTPNTNTCHAVIVLEQKLELLTNT